MNQAHLDTRRVINIKDLLLQLQQGKSEQDVREDFHQHVQDLDTINILLIFHRIKYVYPEVKNKDFEKFFDICHHLYGHTIHDIHVPESDHPNRPIQIFNKENRVFESLLTRLSSLINAMEKDPEHPTDQLQEDMKQLGTLYSHYNRKEKLFFRCHFWT
ncbi:hypothetical protein [Salinibacillus xinjiangensis]|uniref:Hemerythrin-like domain-containing protein n=1 Tax=Salinibacillus xinjiangensis TaxID=1229268 RepID=A0A6G1X716_9BACI|nr:hypothetical protein [Salinibacillus xinjiangensis]MRG86737.1 hypothetical protein [Salinibacillus xinjiangensis]